MDYGGAHKSLPQLSSYGQWWLHEGESAFFKGVPPGRSTMLQRMSPHPWGYGLHRLESMDYKEESTQLGGELDLGGFRGTNRVWIQSNCSVCMYEILKHLGKVLYKCVLKVRGLVTWPGMGMTSIFISTMEQHFMQKSLYLHHSQHSSSCKWKMVFVQVLGFLLVCGRSAPLQLEEE